MSSITPILFPDIDKPIDDVPPVGIIYRIFNKETQQSYIGKTVHSFQKRYPGGSWWKHSTNKLLLQDYLKYGSDAFRVEILTGGHSNDELLSLESLYIYSYNSFAPNGYNLHYDSDPLNHSNEGKIYLAKLSTNKIYVFQKDGKENVIKYYMNSGSGGPCSESTKRKISLANKGKIRTPEQIERMAAKKRGVKQSQESILKRSISLKGNGAKPVLQIDPKTNQVVKEHASMMDAAVYLNLASSANLTSVCKGKQKTAGGFIFKYKYETS